MAHKPKTAKPSKTNRGKNSGQKRKPRPRRVGPLETSRAEANRFRAEDDVRTLQRAEEIKSDKGRLGAARATAQKQVAALNKVTKTSKKGT